MTHESSEQNVARGLSAEEHAFVRWLLVNGSGDNTLFLDQLDRVLVVGVCGCGCASIDFSVDGHAPTNSAGQSLLSDYQWQDRLGRRFGVFVFEQNGNLAGLDLYSIDGEGVPNYLPDVEQLSLLSLDGLKH